MSYLRTIGYTYRISLFFQLGIHDMVQVSPAVDVWKVEYNLNNKDDIWSGKCLSYSNYFLSFHTSTAGLKSHPMLKLHYVINPLFRCGLLVLYRNSYVKNTDELSLRTFV